MNEPLIEHGFAKIAAGTWLVGRGQPTVACGPFSMKGIKGFLAPDRHALAVLDVTQTAYLSDAQRPFLTHLVSVGSLTVVSDKVLVAPLVARQSAKLYRIIPLSCRNAFAITRFASDWAVVATRSRVRRIVLEEGDVVCVKREAIVAWTGKDPTGVSGRVRLRDLFIPKKNTSLALDFYGPQVIWVEGSNGI